MKPPSNIDAVAKKTIRVNGLKAIFEVPACEFYKTTGLFQGDKLVISLASSESKTGKVTRTVSQELLFYYSGVCVEKASSLSVGSDSDEEQTNHTSKIALDEWDAETFDMALQWMHTGNVITNIKSSKPFEQVRSYIQFFKIAKALELEGSLKMVEQNLKNALIAATEKKDDEDTKNNKDNGVNRVNEDEDAFDCNPTFKETLKDAFTHPIDESARELLASFLVEPYVKHLLNAEPANAKPTAKKFKDLFKAVDGLELKVLRYVASLLDGMTLGKPESGDFSPLSMRSPLTGKRFKTGSTFKRTVVAAK
ncbi:hypothetical protein OCU04_000790 [Sclerotinia nivalis]|uniref:BTB domain-containing protein n=1 Tax=Sclerotinia nivalis TaxID=352851 RepID=A0A9X0AWT6_9HELO|nr:hypothetical protein OCU04_000790 [Sclerotinia nivalis]